MAANVSDLWAFHEGLGDESLKFADIARATMQQEISAAGDSICCSHTAPAANDTVKFSNVSVGLSRESDQDES